MPGIRELPYFKMAMTCLMGIPLLLLIYLWWSSRHGEWVFSAGGSFGIGIGHADTPAQIWNPSSDPLVPSSLPYTVPADKTLLLTDMFVESDPLPGDQFLMALLIEGEVNGQRTLSTLRTLQLRAPSHGYASFVTPVPVLGGQTLHVLFSNAAPADQSVNWGVSGRLVEAEVVVHGRSGKHNRVPSVAVPYPPVQLGPVDPMTVLSSQAGPGSGGMKFAGVLGAAYALNARTGLLGRVVSEQDGWVTLVQDVGLLPGDPIVPAWRAAAGTRGDLMVDPQAPSCEQADEVVLLGPARGVFPVIDCAKGQFTLPAVAGRMFPGQVYQMKRTRLGGIDMTSLLSVEAGPQTSSLQLDAAISSSHALNVRSGMYSLIVDRPAQSSVLARTIDAVPGDRIAPLWRASRGTTPTLLVDPSMPGCGTFDEVELIWPVRGVCRVGSCVRGQFVLEQCIAEVQPGQLYQVRLRGSP